jgi:phenylalanyl-tRNA synthetase beta chain
MKISLNWLKEYISTEMSPESIGEVLTDIGLEVEGIEHVEGVKGGLNGVVVGEVKSCTQHPNADRLKLTTVDVGSEELLQIVCGAPNVAEGQKVPVALVGTTLYAEDKEFKIKKGKIRGELSLGMICAEDELGLGSDHSGIMVLDPAVEVGAPLAEVVELEDDHVIEIGLTPNRSDAMSHWGVARDLKAGMQWREGSVSYTSVEWKKPAYDRNPMSIKVRVEDEKRAPRYCGLEIRNVEVGESPDWLKQRLLSIGLGPINNIVDVTNYILHGLGQPLHAFDADMIEGKEVVVRTMDKDTSFTTLDEEERKLDGEDLMICDSVKGMCIAGVFGGNHSGVNSETRNIFLESAYFDPVSVRKSAKRHGLNTDASFRFERGVDPNITLKALEHAAALIVEVAGGSVHGPAVDLGQTDFASFQIEVDPVRMNKLIGQEIKADDLRKIFADLEIGLSEKGPSDWTLSVPPYRTDVQREADIIEDVLRIYGYNRVHEPERMQISLTYSDKPEAHDLQERVSDILAAQGFHEAMSNSLTSAGLNSWAQADDSKRVAMLNPLSGDLAELRTSLIPELMLAGHRNANHKRPDLRFFEFGNRYERTDLKYRETEILLLMAQGKEWKENWQGRKSEYDVFWMRGLCEMILHRLGLLEAAQISGLEHDLLMDGIEYHVGSKQLVAIGRTKGDVRKEMGVKMNPVFAEWNWSETIKAVKKVELSYQEVGKFPEMRRDFALMIDENLSFEAIRTLAEKQVPGSLLRDVRLFDVYMGDKLPKGKKSYAVAFHFRDDKKTMTDKQVDKLMGRIQQALEQEFGAQLR